MPSQKNIDQVAILKTQFATAKSVVLADYRGLSVSEMQTLRAKVKEASGQLTVIKNSLISLALKDKLKDLPADLEAALEGPTALLIAAEDEIGPLKALYQFALEHELPTIKAGLFEDKILSKDELEALAKLPGRQELYAKLVGTLNAPRARFVFALKGNLVKLVLTLKALSEHKN